MQILLDKYGDIDYIGGNGGWTMCNLKSCRQERREGFIRFSVPFTVHRRIAYEFSALLARIAEGPEIQNRIDNAVLWLKTHRGRIYPP